MKFAIFEFEDCSCDIGETAWIYDENEELFDNSSWPFSQKIVVKWLRDFYISKVKRMLKKGVDVDLSTIETQRFSAKVVKFGDQFDGMQTSLETYVKTGKTTTQNKGRGHRIHVKNTRYDVDNEESEAETSEIEKPLAKKKRLSKDTLNTSTSSLLSHVKNKYQPREDGEYTTAELEEECSITPLEEECSELRIQIQKLTSALSGISELPAVVRSLQESVAELKSALTQASHLSRLSRPESPRPASSSPASSRSASSRSASPRPASPRPASPSFSPNIGCFSPATPRTATTRFPSPLIGSDINVDEDDGQFVKLCPGIKILPSQKELLELHGNAKTYTYAVMEMVWSREVLISHSLTGKASNAHKDKGPKPCLDPAKVGALCDLIVKRFRLADDKPVKTYIKSKLNNMERAFKIKKTED